MADDKTKTGGQDRERVAAGQQYEVNDFAEKTGLQPDQVRELIKQFGKDRETLEREAAKLK